MSGAGKSQAANTLEDLGWYCIDNMPALLIPKFAEICSGGTGFGADPAPGWRQGGKVAFVVDIRGEDEFDTLFTRLDELKLQNFNCRTIFMDCADEVIISRYKYTRRAHPLVAAKNISITEALRLEREMLAPVRLRADYIIDTTRLTPAQLKEKISGIVQTGTVHEMFVTCMSFGFKYGAASEADLVFDVRCASRTRITMRNSRSTRGLRRLSGTLSSHMRRRIRSWVSSLICSISCCRFTLRKARRS